MRNGNHAFTVLFFWFSALLPFGSEAQGDRLELKLGLGNGTRTVVFTPESGNARRAVVFLSGSGGVGKRDLGPAENFAKRGVLTVVPYYLERHSEGLKVEFTQVLREDDDKRETVEADLLKIIDQVSEKFSVPRSEFIAQGFSMGGAFVRDMAARTQIRAGVTISGAWIHGEEDEIRLREIVSSKSSPLLILAGTNDELINFNSSISPTRVEAIYREAGAPVEAQYFKGGDHSLRGHTQEMRHFLRAFYRKVASGRNRMGTASPSTSMQGGQLVGPRGLTARQIISRIDGDGDGKISRAEFLGRDQVFIFFDIDEDGFLTVIEFETRWKARYARDGVTGQN